MKNKISTPLALTIFFAYLLMSSLLFFFYGIPSLEGEIPQQMYSDSVTYEQAAEVLELDNELVSIAGNYLGPVLVLRFFNNNRILIHFFNLSILFFSGLIAVRYLNTNKGMLLAGILSSPLLFFSTFGVNKEIFLVPLSIFLLVYLESRATVWLAFSLILAFFVRWQIVAFVVLVFLVESKANPYHKNRFLTLIILAILLSIVYPILLEGPLEIIDQISIEGADDEIGTQASGIYSKMQEIQRSYGYFLVIIPKSIQLLIGFLSRFSISSIEVDFWNNFVIMSQSLHNLFLMALAFAYRRFDLSNNCFFLICIFAVMFAVTPVFAPRYFYPIAIWLALWLASKKDNFYKVAKPTMQQPCSLDNFH